MIDSRPLVPINEIYKEFDKYVNLLEIIKGSFKIDFYGVHGIYHWYFVYLNTKKLSTHYKVESKVFKLFSILHDSKRENENGDKGHGPRAKAFILELIEKGKIDLCIKDLELLLFACENHTKLNTEDDLSKNLIVQICLDSDKLDLPRVGIKPKSKYLLTSYARKINQT
jgi:uncharacterized protein